MFWVYILRCADGSYYTGHTDDLEKRMAQYQVGECAGYTATRLPVAFIWSQETATREKALSVERQIKGWGRKKKEAMMRGDWAHRFPTDCDTSTIRGGRVEVSRLAQSKSVHPSTSSGRTDLLLQGSPEQGRRGSPE